MDIKDFFDQWSKENLDNDEEEKQLTNTVKTATSVNAPTLPFSPAVDPQTDPVNFYSKVEGSMAGFGITEQRELHGAGLSTFLYGLSAHNAGLPPETTGGTVAAIMGEFATMIALSVATEGLGGAAAASAVGRSSTLARFFGAGEGALNLPGRMVVSGAGGGAADMFYQAATPEEEPSYLYAIYPFINAAFPLVLSGIGRAWKAGDTIPGHDGGGMNKFIPDANEAEVPVFHDAVLKAMGTKDEDIATGMHSMLPFLEDVVDPRWKPTAAQINKLGDAYNPDIIKSQAHYDLARLGQLNREYDEANYLIGEEAHLSRTKFLYGTKGEKHYYTEAWGYVQREWEQFVKKMGRNLSPEEQEIIFTTLEGKTPILKDNWAIELVNNTRGLDYSATPLTPARRREILRFTDKVQRANLAGTLGMAPGASPGRVAKRAKQFEDFLSKQQEYMEGHKDPTVRNVLKEVNSTLESLYNNPNTVLSQEFKQSQQWMDAFKALQRFRGVDDIGFRTKQADELLNTLVRSTKNLTAKMNKLNREKFQSFELERVDAIKLEDALYNGTLKPAEYAPLRKHLLTIIRDGVYGLVEKYADDINPDAATRLKNLKVEQLKDGMGVPDESLASAMPSYENAQLTRTQIIQELTTSLLNNPTQLRTLAAAEGDEMLVRSTDMLLASMGDQISAARWMADDILRQRNIVNNIVESRLVVAPGVTLENSIDDLFINPRASLDPFPARTNVTPAGDTVNPKDTGGTPKGGGPDSGDANTATSYSKELDTSTLTGDEQAQMVSEAATQGLLGGISGLTRRLFSTPKHIARHAQKVFKSPILQKAMGQVVDFFDESYRARINLLRTLQEDLNPRLTAFHGWVEANGTVGTNLLKMLDEVSEYADSLMVSPSGKRLENPRHYAKIRPLVEQRIRDVLSTSPELKEGYRYWEDVRTFILNKVNSSIDEYNTAVRDGLLSGEELKHLVDRPGWVPFIYNGSYMLRIVRRNAAGELERHSLGVVQDLQSAHARILKLLDGQNLDGKLILEPRLIDDVTDVIALRDSVGSLDDAFGIDASELKRSIEAGEFTPDTVHQVFYGNKLHRMMSDRDMKMGIQQSLAIAGRMGMRFSSYIHMGRRGRELALSLNNLGLHRWSDYVKVHAEDVMGMARTSERLVDGYLTGIVEGMHRIPFISQGLQQMGIHPHGRTTRAITSGITLFGRLAAIGVNPATAIIQTFILPTNVAPWVGWKNAIWATKYVPKILRKSLSAEDKMFLQKGGVTLRHGGDIMADAGKRHDILLSHGQKALNKLDEIGMYMFNSSEDGVRGVTMFAARRQAQMELAPKILRGTADPKSPQVRLLDRIAKQMGKGVDDIDVAEEYAIQSMKETSFDFDVTGLSELARNPIAKPFMQFKSYFFKELEFLFGRGGLDMTWKQKVQALGMFTAIGGLLALPGVEEIDQISTAVLGFSPKLYVMAYMPEMFSMGLPALAGIDLSSRANIGSFTQAFNPKQLFGVGGSKAKQAIGGILGAASRGELPSFSESFGTVTAMRNLQETYQLLTTGRVSDRYGNTVVSEQNLTGLQMILRTMGFGDPHTNKMRMLATYMKHQSKEMKDQKLRGRKLYFDAIAAKDTEEAGKIAAEYGLNTRELGSPSQYQRLYNATPRELRRMVEEYAKQLQVGD